MAAKLVFHQKHVLADGTIVEMVIWRLPTAHDERRHDLKYRLYGGDTRGRCLVRYDNERGKGDHKHVDGVESEYAFTTVERLVADFLADLAQRRER